MTWDSHTATREGTPDKEGDWLRQMLLEPFLLCVETGEEGGLGG